MKKRLRVLLTAALLFSMLTPLASALNIVAQSAFVMDGDTGEALFSKSGDTARVPASMTKVLTAYITYQEIESGALSMDTQVKISANVAQKSRSGAYPMAVPLAEGKTYSVETLLNLVLIPSASASCIALAEHIEGSEAAFVARMNNTAKELGLNATYYNSHGAQPNYITARSQAKLTRQFIEDYPEVLSITSKPSYTFNGRTYNNTNHLLNTMETYAGLDGFKTGTIPEAGYCVTTTAVRNGRRVIAVVMKSTSNAQRFADSRLLLDYGFAEIERRDKARASTTVAFSNTPTEIVPFVPFAVSATLSGATVPYEAKAQWYINGEPVQGFGNDNFVVTQGKTSTLHTSLRGAHEGTATVRFVLTMPDGTEKAAETVLSVTGAVPGLDGRLNIREASVYPGKTLRITADIVADASIPNIEIPARWEWDGAAIAGYGNNAFQVKNGAAKSGYALKIPQDAAPGTHKLSFVLNPEEIAGVPRIELCADIAVVLPEEKQPESGENEQTETESQQAA